MAITFLAAINASLKRVRVIQGDAGELGTSTVTSTATGLTATGAFVDSGRQVQIDLMIMMWNEATHVLYNLGMLASGVNTATLNLVADTNEYTVPSDFERMAGDDHKTMVVRGATNGRILPEYQGGYDRLFADRPIATDYVGEPNAWVISPISGNVVFDTYPTDDEDGLSYEYLYHKRLQLTSTMATETLPFSDTVADAFVPVCAEGWSRVMKKEFDSSLFQSSLIRAVQTATRQTGKRRWGIRRGP